MLKCNINSKGLGLVKVRARGTAEDLVPEVGMVVKMVHNNIHRESPEAAKVFKNRLIGLLLDPKSPVWNADS